MIIAQITITNFGSYYGCQTIDLSPDPENISKRIIAIGGLNGAGKTTLKDAISFGLLGHDDALYWIYGLARKSESKRERDRRLNNLLNRRALAEGNTEASVRLKLLDGAQTIDITRTWSFYRDGRFQEEQLSGAIGGLDGLSHDRFSDYLKNTIPPEVVPFFVFDGEEIQRIATDDPGERVRRGIDTILGFHLCDALASDMSKLQDDYRREATKHSELEAELALLRAGEATVQTEIAKIEEEQSHLEETLDDLRRRGEELASELSAVLGSDATTNPKEMQQQLERTHDRITELRGQLNNAIERSIVPALAGPLVRTLLQQLDGEEARARWEEGKQRVHPQRERLLIRVFGPGAPRPTPPLDTAQSDFLHLRIRHEWDSLFHPPPPGIAADVRHGDLEAGERAQARVKCLQAIQAVSGDMKQTLAELDDLDRRQRDLRTAFDRISDRERADDIVRAQKMVERERTETERRWDDNKRRLPVLRRELGDYRKKITNKEDDIARSSEFSGKLAFARKVRRAIQMYQEALRPRKRSEIQDHLTYMYSQLARKTDIVQRIELDEKRYEPRLLSQNGSEIPLGAQSAGEKEIYALSLLWALSKGSGRDLPVVIDTPLARLDSAHRDNIVTRYLPEAGIQVIVLSTDTEIDQRTFDGIRQYTSRAMSLEFDAATERTIVRDGFFHFE